MTIREISAAQFRKERPDLTPRKVKGDSSWVRRSRPEDRTIEGITFDSRAESWRYLELRGMKARGEIDGFVRQPLFDLAGVKYHADFLVWHLGADPEPGGGDVWAEDVKGKSSHPEVMRRFRRNQKQVMELYDLEVFLVEM